MAYPFTAKNWVDFPTTTTPITAAALEDLEDRVTDYTDNHMELVTSLPTGANRFLGRQVMYKPSGSASSPVWHCIWDTALNGGSGAWAVVGGGPLYAHVATSQSTTSTTFTNLTTDGPSVTIPSAGIYRCQWSTNCKNAVSGEFVASAITGPGVTADLNYSTNHFLNFGTSMFGMVEYTFTGSGSVKIQYRTQSGSNASTFERRSIFVVPIELRP